MALTLENFENWILKIAHWRTSLPEGVAVTLGRGRQPRASAQRFARSQNLPTVRQALTTSITHGNNRPPVGDQVGDEAFCQLNKYI